MQQDDGVQYQNLARSLVYNSVSKRPQTEVFATLMLDEDKFFVQTLTNRANLLSIILNLSILLHLYTLHIHFIQSLIEPYNYEFFLYCIPTCFGHIGPSSSVLLVKTVPL
jgi:hypothetical protein